MYKRALTAIMVVALLSIFFLDGCKTVEEIVNDFIIANASGYSKKITTLDPDDTGLTSLSLFFAIRNHSDTKGTITRWSFKIRHNIVTLVEVNSDNYKNLNLVIVGETTVPANEITEFYVNTPQPFLENALPKEKLSFDQYIPNEVVVDLEIQGDDGKTHTVTGKGTYTYEQGVLNQSKYNIVGQWELKAIINGNKIGTQKLSIVGTKSAGQFVLYKPGSGTIDINGSYVVNNYKYFTFMATNGTKYWGEFTDITSTQGTLLIPYDEHGNPVNKTGSWTAQKK